LQLRLHEEHVQFQECAKRYRLCGAPLQALCEYNSEIALSVGRPIVAQFWQLISTIFTPEASHIFLMLMKLSSVNRSQVSRHYRRLRRQLLRRTSSQVQMRLMAMR